MNKRFTGFLCQFAGVVIALCGLIPAALLLNPWRNVLKDSELVPIYFLPNLIKTIMIALAGFIAGYLLLRLGSHLKSRGKSVETSTAHGSQ